MKMFAKYLFQVTSIMFSCLVVINLIGCTISFQNISTHGTASDVVDDNFKTDPQVDASLDMPLNKMQDKMDKKILKAKKDNDRKMDKLVKEDKVRDKKMHKCDKMMKKKQ